MISDYALGASTSRTRARLHLSSEELKKSVVTKNVMFSDENLGAIQRRHQMGDREGYLPFPEVNKKYENK